MIGNLPKPTIATSLPSTIDDAALAKVKEQPALEERTHGSRGRCGTSGESNVRDKFFHCNTTGPKEEIACRVVLYIVLLR